MRTHGHRKGNILHWGLLGSGGTKGGIAGGGGNRGGIALEEIPNVDDGVMGAAKTTMARVYLCNKPVRSAHVPKKLKYNKKYK